MVDADPVPVVLERLRGDAAVTAALGGAAHVGGRREDPWPHLQVTNAPGAVFGDGLSAGDFPVDLTLWGHPDRRESNKALRDALVLALESLLGLGEGAAYTAGSPVVADVRVVNGPEDQPLTSGQQRWSATVFFSMTPPV